MSEGKESERTVKPKIIRVLTKDGILREFHPGNEPSPISFCVGEFVMFNEPTKRAWLRVDEIQSIEEEF